MNKNKVSFLMLVLLVSVLPACWRKKDEYSKKVVIHNGRKTEVIESDYKLGGDTDLEVHRRGNRKPNCRKSESCANKRMTRAQMRMQEDNMNDMSDMDDMNMMSTRDRQMNNSGRRMSHKKRMSDAQMRMQKDDMNDNDMDTMTDEEMNEKDRQMMIKRGK